MHIVVGCRIDICRAIAEREWGWTLSARSVPQRQSGALNEDKEFVRFISNADHLREITPETKVYLGYEWLFAWGQDPRDYLRRHIERGGKVLKFNNEKFEEVNTL